MVVEWLRARQRIIVPIIFAILLIVFISIIIKYGSKIQFSLILINWKISILLLLLAALFMITKSLMLFYVGRLFLVKRGFLHFLKVFCTSSFIELTSFTGKIGADGFKYYLWKEISKKKRLSLILFLRSADISGFLLLLGLFLFPRDIFLIGLLVLPIVFFLAAPLQLRKKGSDWIFTLILSSVSYLILITQLGLVFDVLGVSFSFVSAKVFLISHGLGVLSQLPFGLGVKDFSIFYLLKDVATETIILGMIWVRMLGEFFSVFLGAFFVSIFLRK